MNWVGDWIQNNIDEKDTVIDFGCGIMQSTTDIVPTYPRTKLKCKRLVGVDIYKPYLDKLNEKGIETVLWDLTKTPYPFEDKSFDVGILTDIFEHLPSINAVDMLIEQAKRIVRKKLFVITPTKFFDNIINVIDAPYPYKNLGSNKYQEHKILIDKNYLEKNGFKVNKRGIHYMGLNNLFNIIVHVWDCAGVASLISKYQNKLGYDSQVIVNSSKDSYNFNEAYSGYRTRYVSTVPDTESSKYNIYRKILNQYRVFRRIKFAMKGMNPDIIHFHSLNIIPIWFKLLGYKILLEFHGTRMRVKYYNGTKNKMRHTRRWLFILYWILRIPIFVSTPDLIRDVPSYNRPKNMSRLISNPVDLEIFNISAIRESCDKAIYSLNHYDVDMIELAKMRAYKRGYKLHIHNRMDGEKMDHVEFSKFLSSFDCYIDRINIDSLSKTALECLALGLKVVNWKGDVMEGLPIQHEPFNVAKKTIEIYNKILSNQI